ncbi:MAG: hypothetical protein HYX60_11645 [Legionella longbeachae]|nr:hypothetical protein [Legionella longbeachae]
MRNELTLQLNRQNPMQLILRDMHIVDDELEEIVKKIEGNKLAIEDVVLSNNHISDTGAGVLAGALASFPKLKFLDIQFNQLDEDGIRKLYTLKSNHPDLKFAFYGNKVTDASLFYKIEKGYEHR